MEKTSLTQILDEINEVGFYNQDISKIKLENSVKRFCKQQIKSGNNAGMFYVPENDYKIGLRLFTGEKLKTKLATRNIFGQEATRLLRLSNISTEEVQTIIEKADRWMLKSCYAADYCFIGECAHSAIGFMRYLAVAEPKNTEQQLIKYIELIRKRRDGKGKWKGLPFHYTLLTLLEVNNLLVIDELRYTLPAIERSLKRTNNNDKFSQRRRDVMKRVLDKLRDQKPV
ncbi:MAG: hypothetical protein ACFFC7_05065 [Candidatus Hermodarchaeota archaeon]